MKICAAAFLSVFLAVASYGVTIDRPDQRLVVHHSKPATVNVNDDPKKSTPLSSPMSWTRRHDENVRVVIDDPDPLVFTYTWKGVTKSPTADFTAASAFAESVGAFAKELSSFAPKAKAQNAAADVSGTPQSGSRVGPILRNLGVTPPDLEKLSTDLTTLSDWAKKIPVLTSQSAKSKQDAETVKQTVLGWDVETTVTDAQMVLKKIDAASDRLLQELLKVPGDNPAQPVGSSPSGSVGNTSGSATGTSGSTGSMGTTGDKKSQTKKKQEKQTETNAAAQNITVAPSDIDLGFAYLIASSKSQRVADLMKSLRAFVAAAKQINEPIVLDPIEYSASDVVTGKLEIGKVEGAKADDVAQRATGTFEFATNPYTPAHLSNLGAAAVYSFVEVPQYSTKALTNGKFQIVRTDSGNAVNGLTVAGMLALTPLHWANPTVGGSFQVGVSPVKDRLAVLGGATLNLYSLFSLGGGIIYQQAQRLGAGLREGQDDLASADALKTTTHFKSGFYLSVTVKVK